LASVETTQHWDAIREQAVFNPHLEIAIIFLAAACCRSRAKNFRKLRGPNMASPCRAGEGPTDSLTARHALENMPLALLAKIDRVFDGAAPVGTAT